MISISNYCCFNNLKIISDYSSNSVSIKAKVILYIWKHLLINIAKCITGAWFLSLFQHTKRHYHYLEDTYPHLLPSSKKEKLNNNFETTNTAKFAKQIVSNVSSAATLKTEAKVKVLSRSCQDLEKLASIEPSLGDAAIFAQTYIKCQILMLKCLSGKNHAQ